MTHCPTLPEVLAPESGATRGSYDKLVPLSEVRLLREAWFGSTTQFKSRALSMALLTELARKLQKSSFLGGDL